MQRPNHNAKQPRRADITGSTLGFLLILTILPSVALVRLSVSVDWRILLGLPVALSLISFFLYRSDKRRAETGSRRIPEATLHAIDFLGGWPGTFLAQQWFRHKTAKLSFRIVFWLTVAIHEFLALDYLLAWRFTKQTMHWIASHLV